MSTIFEGIALVYLQGSDAILLLTVDDNCYRSAIGSEETELIVTDYRKRPVQIVNRLIDGEHQLDFASEFNQPARVKVQYDYERDGLEIELDDGPGEIEYPILWMGILDEYTMPAHEVAWEVLKKHTDERIAFAALLAM